MDIRIPAKDGLMTNKDIINILNNLSNLMREDNRDKAVNET
jgi:hypothetical protein